MIINDLPCLVVIPDHDEIVGGKQIKFCSFNFEKLYGIKAEAYAYADGKAEAYVYADGKNVWGNYGTSICLDGDVSTTHSFAQSCSQS